MQKLTLEGKISISDTPSLLNHMNIIITNLVDKTETSLTNILDTISGIELITSIIWSLTL